jgi:hypothetical protein
MEKFKFIRLTGSLTLTVIVALTFSLNSCKKECNDPCNLDCDNYDPCCGQTAADASFTIFEVLNLMPNLSIDGFIGEDVATDTIVFLNAARFRADFEAEYYEWSIGSDPRVWNTREFSLKFRTITPYTPVEVRLKVYKPTSNNCFPNVTDTAFFKRTLVTVPRDSSLVFGRYTGYLGAEPSSINFFEFTPEVHSSGREGIRIKGIKPNCSLNLEISNPRYAVGYRSLFFNTRAIGVGCCLGLGGFGVINSVNSGLNMVVGHYPPSSTDSCMWEGLSSPYLNDSFNGTKQ